MKIGFLNNMPIYTGMGKCAFGLHEALHRRKSEIDHVFLNWHDRTVQIEQGSASQVIATTKSVASVDWKPFFWYRCRKLIPEYDLYHLTNQNLSLLLQWGIHGARGKPCLVTCFDVIRYSHPQTKFDLLIRKYLYRGLQKADKVITMSRQSKADLIKYLNISEDKIAVVYGGVDAERYHPSSLNDHVGDKYNLSPGTRIVLYVGSETPRKNVPIVIEAFAKLRQNHQQVALFKVGEAQFPGARARHLRMVNELGLADNVTFIDHVRETDLPKIYQTADLVVFPSLAEGLGLPVLEAMACGVPVVSANIAPLAEMVGNAGLLVDPNDASALAQAMYDVLTNDGFRQAMVEKGLTRAKMFTWDKAAEDTLQVYRELVPLD